VVSRSRYVPERGDLVWLQFTPQAGHEQGGRRPTLIVSPRAYNAKVGLALCCPITSQVKGYPFEVELGAKAKVHGAVLADQLKSLDWRARGAKKIERVSATLMNEVLVKIAVLVGIES
jgi:mRNA interferase MazF